MFTNPRYKAGDKPDNNMIWSCYVTWSSKLPTPIGRVDPLRGMTTNETIIVITR